MKDNTHVIGQDAIGANRTRTFVFITRLCATLVSHELLPLLVLGAPSTSGPGLQTDFRFTYNTSDIYVDRVCRRAPVLLDPSAEPPCRIVDRNCLVDNPCVNPDPVDRLLAIAPCPPVWNPALVCSSDIGTKLECSEKFEILWKCFLSSNKTLYYLTTPTESCKVKHACGHWFKACPGELPRLSDVFVNCVPDRRDNGDRSTVTTDGLEVRTPDEVPVLVVWWILAGILLPSCSMIILFVICKRRHSRRQKMRVTVKRSSGFDETIYHGSVNVIVEIAVEGDVVMETTPFLADDVPQENHPRSVDTQKTTPCSVDSREAENYSETFSAISQDKQGSEAETFTTISQDKPGSEAETFTNISEDKQGSEAITFTTISQDKPGSEAETFTNISQDKQGSDAETFTTISQDKPGSEAETFTTISQYKPGSEAETFTAISESSNT